MPANDLIGRDAFGESIGYYGDGDYSAIDPARWDNTDGHRADVLITWRGS